MKIGHTVICSILVCLLFCACGKTGKETRTAGGAQIRDSISLKNYIKNYKGDCNSIDYCAPVWAYLVRIGDRKGIVDFTVPFYERSRKNGYEDGIVYSAAYLAQIYLYFGSPDSLRIYLDEIVKHDINNKELKALINSIEGIYALRYELDYSKAMDYFLDSQPILKETQSYEREVINLCNISYIYIMRSDPMGYKFAKKALDLCHQYQMDGHFECISQICLAELHLLDRNYGKALDAIQVAEALAVRDHLTYLMLNVYSTKAHVYSTIGSEYDAMQALREAKKYLEDGQTSDIIDFYFNAGECCNRFHKLEEALKNYYKVLELSYDYREVGFRKEALLEISKIQEQLGEEELSYIYLKRYNRFIDSILNVQKERDFSHYQLLIQKAEHEKAIQKSEIELLKANRKVFFVGGVFIVLFIVIILVLISVIHKNKMYAQLVKIHQKNLRKINPELMIKAVPHAEERVEAEPEQQAEEVSVPDADTDGGADRELDRSLFEQIEALMVNEKVFTDKDLTLEKIAGMLNSNRTYVSRAINNFAGCGFISYVNTYRINEATRILACSNIPLKRLCEDVGFVSSSTFYRAFQKETGCSPSRYRTELIKLKKEEDPSSNE